MLYGISILQKQSLFIIGFNYDDAELEYEE